MKKGIKIEIKRDGTLETTVTGLADFEILGLLEVTRLDFLNNHYRTDEEEN